MSYSLHLDGKVKKFPSLRELSSWVSEVLTKNEHVKYKAMYKGEKLDDVDVKAMCLYLNHFQYGE